jgi:hypothetical protein
MTKDFIDLTGKIAIVMGAGRGHQQEETWTKDRPTATAAA